MCNSPFFVLLEMQGKAPRAHIESAPTASEVAGTRSLSKKCIVGASTARPQKRCGSRSAAGPSGARRPTMLLFLLRLVPQHLLRKMPCKELHERS